MNAPRPPALDAPTATGRRRAGRARFGRAARHRCGAAYTDDLPEPRGTLHAAARREPDRARPPARRSTSRAVRAAPGVVDVIIAADIPGVNDVGPIQHDDPILAARRRRSSPASRCSPCAAARRRTPRGARRGSRSFDLEPLPAILTIDDALRGASRTCCRRSHVTRGDAAAALAARAAPPARHVRARRPGPLLPRRADCARGAAASDGGMHVHASTQHPGEVQHMVAHALGIAAHDVVVECRRMGGGFGGKETQMSLFACVAADRRAARPGARPSCASIATTTCARPASATRSRYAYDVGFDDEGRILGARPHARLALRLFGRSLRTGQRSRGVPRRQRLLAARRRRCTRYRCKTNTVSDTAFRGFGGPQGMFADRARDRRDRARAAAAIRSTCAAPTSTARRAQRHALRHDGRGQHRARDHRASSRHRRATAQRRARDRAVESRQARSSSAASR